MQSKIIAFALNFFLPGAGFVYLRRWRFAALNFGIALVIGAALGFLLPGWIWRQFGEYFGFALGGGSGVWAMDVADQMNKASEPSQLTTTDDGSV